MPEEHRIKFNIANIVFEITGLSEEAISELMQTYPVFLTRSKSDFKIHLSMKRYQNKTADFQRAILGSDCLYIQQEYFKAKINFKKAKVWIEASPGFGIMSFLRFLISLIAPEKKQGFLLHAAAVSDNNYGYVFVGPSESGKTTLARLSSKDKIVLTDETAAIVKTDGNYYVWSTPFIGEFGQVKQNMASPVKAVYFIKKDSQFRHRQLEKAEAVKLFLGNVILGLQDVEILNCLFDLFENFTKRIPCYEFGFKPEVDIWRYIYGFT
ncbi:MAG: hypothetical protein NC908_01145 [Candidatus Omnitrophica bacterium]|nr:hypothetical protein [Candidatus Omnitrophota bacterium]